MCVLYRDNEKGNLISNINKYPKIKVLKYCSENQKSCHGNPVVRGKEGPDAILDGETGRLTSEPGGLTSEPGTGENAQNSFFLINFSL